MKTLHCVISGRVQGVFFRAWTKNQAQAQGLAGWVRNLPGGKVELMAQGPDEQLQCFLELLHEGPPLARVERVESGFLENQGSMVGFAVTG